MLNRTNLTQTALLNGLNLGTRSLVLGTSLNTKGNALTVRANHHGLMRAGMSWHAVKPVMKRIYDIPEIPIPCFVPQSPQFESSRSASKRPGSLGRLTARRCSLGNSIADRSRDVAVGVARRASTAVAAAAAGA